MADTSHHHPESSSDTNKNNNGTPAVASMPPPSTTHTTTTTSTNNNQPTDPVLHRLKELEDSNNQNSKALEKMKKELLDKEEKIKILSADKRKEMEGILSSAIDNWLNSLSGVSDENKSNFRQGISKLAEHADMNNAAWEIVCNASELHKHNVHKIEELLAQAKDRERELGDLKGFKTEASRISGVKRPRTDDPIPLTSSTTSLASKQAPEEDHDHNNTTNNNNIWDSFQSMLYKDSRATYY